MRIGFSCGWTEEYWAGWPWRDMYGGSEHILVEVASALAAQGHEVTVRLPRDTPERVYRGVRWVGLDHRPERYGCLFAFDDFERRDDGDRVVLVSCRSDPPRHRDFDIRVYLSKTHAQLSGEPDAPYIGGGVNLSDYTNVIPRITNRVICTSSPDRCPDVACIGKAFDFKHAYKPVPGFVTTMYERSELIELQQSAQVLIYPLAPRRPSDFFSMAVLESLAAGTPVVVSDADSMPELWSDAAIVLPNPIDLGLWHDTVSDLLENPVLWRKHSRLGKAKAQHYSWDKVALRYLEAACR